MLPSLGDYLIIGVVAAAVTFVATPVVGWFARRRNWVYVPNERSVHTSPVPDVGGLAMLIGFLAALGVARMLDQFDGLFHTQHRAGRTSRSRPSSSSSSASSTTSATSRRRRR